MSCTVSTPDVAASSIQTLDECRRCVDRGVARGRSSSADVGPLAILLCTIGVYAVASFSGGH
jgi:hypothetical protein